MTQPDSLPKGIFKQALDNALDMIMITDVNPKDPGSSVILYVNDLFVDIFEYQKDEIIGQSPVILQGEETDPKAMSKINDALLNGWPVHTEILNYSKSGKGHWIDLKIVPLFNDQGEVSHFLLVERDLSERKSRENKLYQAATLDGLTNLFNRHHTYQVASQRIEQAARYHGILSVLMLDIDHFKRINDSYGHPVGDKVLQTLSRILQQEVRKADILGRVGGEEFFVMLPEIRLDDAKTFAERVRNEVATADWKSLGLAHQVTISIGVTQFDPQDNLERLISRADQAMYQAKSDGRNRVRCLSAPE